MQMKLTLTVTDPTADARSRCLMQRQLLLVLLLLRRLRKAQRGTVVALTDAATIAVDLSLANNFSVTLAGNRTLGAPTNTTAGQSGVIVVTQDSTGSRHACIQLDLQVCWWNGTDVDDNG